jgi:hypothetical protein
MNQSHPLALFESANLRDLVAVAEFSSRQTGIENREQALSSTPLCCYATWTDNLGHHNYTLWVFTDWLRSLRNPGQSSACGINAKA